MAEEQEIFRLHSLGNVEAAQFSVKGNIRALDKLIAAGGRPDQIAFYQEKVIISQSQLAKVAADHAKKFPNCTGE